VGGAFSGWIIHYEWKVGGSIPVGTSVASLVSVQRLRARPVTADFTITVTHVHVEV